jgi:hypothetical protein
MMAVVPMELTHAHARPEQAGNFTLLSAKAQKIMSRLL